MNKIEFPDDATLLQAIRNGGRGEERATKQLLKQVRNLVFHLVTRNGGSEADAEDVLYESVSVAILAIRDDRFRGSSKLSTYLFAVARGIWFKRLRSRKHEFSDPFDEAIPEAVLEDPLTGFFQDEMKNETNNLLDHLKGKCREVLLLWAAKHNMDEIAKRMGFQSAQVAMNKKSKCLREVREMLAGKPLLRQRLKQLLYHD